MPAEAHPSLTREEEIMQVHRDGNALKAFV